MKRLLVVDDHEENLHLLRVLLESQGYAVHAAHDGVEALQIARSDPPDLIVSDILMPGMDGFALCREWKTDQRLHEIPFVFYTATYTDLKDEKLALDLGADAFITKPVEPEDFLAKILAALARTQTSPAAHAPEAPAELEGIGRQYNEALVRKLENKMIQLERANRALEHEMAERRHTEQALQESESRFRALFETMSQGVVYFDAGGRVAMANPAAEHILGLSEEHLRSLDPADIDLDVVEEDGAPLPRGGYPHVVARLTGLPDTGTIVGVRTSPHGERRWIMVDAVPRPLSDGSPPNSVYATFTDITDRKLAMDALRAQAAFDELMERLLSRIASASSADVDRCIAESMQLVAEFMRVESSVVFQTSDDLATWGATYGWATPGFASVAGWLKNQPRGTLPWVEDELLAGKRIVLQSAHEIPAEAEQFHELWQKQGLSSAILVPLRSRGGVFRGGLGLFRVSNERGWEHQDIRHAEQLAEAFATALERKHAEDSLRESDKQLRQAQKMEAIGQLAGGIAHDFNNLLTAIIGYSNLLLGRAEASDPGVRNDVTEIRHAAERAGGLTRQILAFSRRQTLQPEVVSMNDVITGMEPLLRHTLGEGVQLVVRAAHDLGHVEVDVHQFEQVLLNLAVNARDAMPAGGQLTLETSNVELGEEYRRLHPEAGIGSYVMLVVSDTGTGMDSATLAQIFEPFFTTKEKGKGTGLGLSTVYGIVKQSGGSIFVYSEPGIGTSFKIYMPRVLPATRAEIPPVPAQTLPRGSEALLVVEDEEALQRLITRVLNSLGYTAYAVGSGDEAMAYLVDTERRLDLLLTDMVLPGKIQGNVLAEQARNLRPGLPIICMSGYAFDTVENASRLVSGAIYLEKPFRPEALASVVRKALDARTQTPGFSMP
ncbi:MAG: response regulator [Thermoleophilia bacterium]|nr:response regulator [Thermoleophilia bacterium]